MLHHWPPPSSIPAFLVLSWVIFLLHSWLTLALYPWPPSSSILETSHLHYWSSPCTIMFITSCLRVRSLAALLHPWPPPCALVSHLPPLSLALSATSLATASFFSGHLPPPVLVTYPLQYWSPCISSQATYPSFAVVNPAPSLRNQSHFLALLLAKFPATGHHSSPSLASDCFILTTCLLYS